LETAIACQVLVFEFLQLMDTNVATAKSAIFYDKTTMYSHCV